MLNIPNLLTAGRIVSIPLFIILVIDQLYYWALVLFVGAALSDAVDGLLARLLHQRTELGTYLDPAADKLLSSSSFITLAVLNILPGWLVVIVISRDVIISLGILLLYFSSRPFEIRPSLPGKLTTLFQLCTIGFALFFKLSPPIPFLMDFFIGATAFLTVLSGMQYLGRGIKLLN